MAKHFLVAGSAFGFLAVCLGAFAAHALKDKLDAYALGVFQTAAQYQFYHSLALLVVGVLALTQGPEAWKGAGYCFIFGILIFSGSLYALAFTGVKVLGAITPIGGTAFLAGWILFF